MLTTGSQKAEDQDPRYMVPIMDRLLCYLPLSVRRKFWCGVRFDDVTTDAHGHFIRDDKPTQRVTYGSVSLGG